MRRVLALLFGGALLLAFGFIFFISFEQKHVEIKKSASYDQFISTASFIDPQKAERVWQNVKVRRDSCGVYQAGVVNHHTLAADLEANFFLKLARCRPDLKRIVILSPDHYFKASAPIVVGQRSYLIKSERLEIDTEWIEQFIKKYPSLIQQDEPFENEHGVGALAPFIHRAYPNIKIVPILVRSWIDKETAGQFAEALKNVFDEKTFLVVSSDMSHTLPVDQALRNDERTKRAFAQNDQAFFWQAQDTYTDSGRAIWIVQQVLRQKTWHLLDQGISTTYGTAPSNVTTYINGYWE